QHQRQRADRRHWDHLERLYACLRARYQSHILKGDGTRRAIEPAVVPRKCPRARGNPDEMGPLAVGLKQSFHFEAAEFIGGKAAGKAATPKPTTAGQRRAMYHGSRQNGRRAYMPALELNGDDGPRL